MSLQITFSKYTPPEAKDNLKARSFAAQKKLLTPILSLISKVYVEPQKLIRLSKCEIQELIDLRLLDRKIETPVLEFSEDLPALLGQIHADSIIGGSEFENIPSKIGIHTLIKYLQSSTNVKISSNLIESLNQLQSQQEFSNLDIWRKGKELLLQHLLKDEYKKVIGEIKLRSLVVWIFL